MLPGTQTHMLWRGYVSLCCGAACCHVPAHWRGMLPCFCAAAELVDVVHHQLNGAFLQRKHGPPDTTCPALHCRCFRAWHNRHAQPAAHCQKVLLSRVLIALSQSAAESKRMASEARAEVWLCLPVLLTTLCCLHCAIKSHATAKPICFIPVYLSSEVAFPAFAMPEGATPLRESMGWVSCCSVLPATW